MRTIYPESYSVYTNKGYGLSIIGSNNKCYTPQEVTYECEAIITNDVDIDYFTNKSISKSNETETIKLCNHDNDNINIIKNAFITSYDLSINKNGKQELSINFVSTKDKTIKFDLIDKKNVEIPLDSYNQFKNHYGKPERMSYDEFYNKYVAIEI